jgi:hypothetical protein
MTIAIPIITEFDGGGISSAVKEFKNLETSGQKAQFAIKRAAGPAIAALGGLTTALGFAIKGAIDDAAAQDKLAEQIKRTTGATDDQIAMNEDWITIQGKLLGVTDDELRPALGDLVRATGDITKAQELAAAAMDISAAKGISLDTATRALEKAYGGNLTALAKISPELRDMIRDGASLDDVMAKMSKTFGGAASDAADTTAGKFKLMKIQLDETKETIGAALLPAVEAVLPFLQTLATWAQDNPQTFTIIAGALAAVAASVVAINIAMSLNPIGLIVIAVGLVVAALAIAYTKFEGFRAVVDDIFGAIKWYVMNVAVPYFQFLGSIVGAVFNQIKDGWNNTVGGFSFQFPDWIKYTGVVGAALAGKGFSVPKIGGGGGGGGATSSVRAFEESQKNAPAIPSALSPPTVAASAPGKPQNTAPPVFDNTSGNAGGFENAGIGGIGPFNDIIINMDAGLVYSPATVGQDIIDAILAAQRNSGQVFAPAVTF